MRHLFMVAGHVLRAILVARIFVLPACATPPATEVHPVWLGEVIDPWQADSELSHPAIDKTPKGSPLKAAGRVYERGVGVQVETTMQFTVNDAERFSAEVAVDDSTIGESHVRVLLRGDGKTVWRSPTMRRGDAPVVVDVEIGRFKKLLLEAFDADDTQSRAFVDWLGARFIVKGKDPESAKVRLTAEKPYLLTPPDSTAPCITSARVFGVRKNAPFLFCVTATGDRPMKFTADNLPAGLTLDPVTGQMTGKLSDDGEVVVHLHATNSVGKSDRDLRVAVGDRLALTPPIGWTNRNCSIQGGEQKQIEDIVDYFGSCGLADHGWTYIALDDGWQGRRGGALNALQPSEKFSDLPRLIEKTHDAGMKIGLYSTPWVTSYGLHPGSTAENSSGAWSPPSRSFKRGLLPWAVGRYTFAENDARQWAAWGIDYLKYEWAPNELVETEEMADALKGSGRDIVFALGDSIQSRDVASVVPRAQTWASTRETKDNWGGVSEVLFDDRAVPLCESGHWHDLGPLMVGYLDAAKGTNLQRTHLTPSEQYTQVSLWALLSSPLFISCDVGGLDAFTLNLLGNAEVIDVDQDPLGRPAVRIGAPTRKQIWLKEMSDGSRVVGLFNLSQRTDSMRATWEQLGITGPYRVRDVWRQVDLGEAIGEVSADVRSHGVLLLRLSPVVESRVGSPTARADGK